jgi:hypothetical protein
VSVECLGTKIVPNTIAFSGSSPPSRLVHTLPRDGGEWCAHDEGLPTPSHTCEHLLVAVKMPAGHPREEPIPWDSDPTLRALRRGVDTDVVVAEVRETSRKPDEVYGVIER